MDGFMDEMTLECMDSDLAWEFAGNSPSSFIAASYIPSPPHRPLGDAILTRHEVNRIVTQYTTVPPTSAPLFLDLVEFGYH